MKIVLLTIMMAFPLSAQFLTPDWRGQEGASHAQWDLFSHAKFEPNAPDVVADPDAVLISSTSGAFLTSSRNIYSFQAPLALQLDDNTELDVRNLLLQVRTLGSGLNTDGVVLLYEDHRSGTTSVKPARFFVTSEEELTGERGGIGTTYGFQWDLRETPVSGNYTILFGASTTSLSLDQVSLDLSEGYQEVAKPEPLAVRVVGGEVLVSWFGGRRLQSSRSLAGDWSDVPGAEGVNEIRLPFESGSRFFRLSQPVTSE